MERDGPQRSNSRHEPAGELPDESAESGMATVDGLSRTLVPQRCRRTSPTALGTGLVKEPCAECVLTRGHRPSGSPGTRGNFLPS